MKQARIEDGVVVELAPADAEFEAGLFQSCPDRVVEGWRQDGDILRAPNAEEQAEDDAKTLEWLRPEALTKIATLAETARLQHLTPGAGQALVYERKLRQAQAYMAANSGLREAGAWDYLSAERGLSGANHLNVARKIIARAQVVDAALATIEQTRFTAKAAIADAATPAEVEAGLQSLTQTLSPTADQGDGGVN